jgi:hypothetical protein
MTGRKEPRMTIRFNTDQDSFTLVIVERGFDVKKIKFEGLGHYDAAMTFLARLTGEEE